MKRTEKKVPTDSVGDSHTDTEWLNSYQCDRSRRVNQEKQMSKARNQDWPIQVKGIPYSQEMAAAD